MTILYTQNWDSVTPPAAPSNWTFDSGITTATTPLSGGILPTSTPNVLDYNPASSNAIKCASYGVQDGVSGNVTVQASFNASILGSHCRMGVVCRSDTYPFTSVSGNFYRGVLKIDTSTADIQYYQSGTVHTLNTLNITGVLSAKTWYIVFLEAQGSLLSLSILRLADSYYLNSLGAWSPPIIAPCLSATDSNLTGQGYSGITMEQNAVSGGDMYSDDFVLTGVGPPPPVPVPVIVRVPRFYYPGVSDGGPSVISQS